MKREGGGLRGGEWMEGKGEEGALLGALGVSVCERIPKDLSTQNHPKNPIRLLCAFGALECYCRMLALNVNTHGLHSGIIWEPFGFIWE